MNTKERIHKALFPAKNRTEQDTIKKMTDRVKPNKEQAQIDEIKDLLFIK
jgi:hypothetical protein